MRIGELLVMNGIINEEQLDQALKEQARNPKKLGGIMIELGFITERQLVEALEFQLGVPVVNLNEAVFDLATVQIIDESIARKHHLVPISSGGGKIKVAMIDPLNKEAIKAIQMATGMSVQPFIAMRMEMEEAINRYYGSDTTAETLNEIIQAGVYQQARGIHIEPHEDGLMVKYRIDNTLKSKKTLSKKMHETLFRHIKLLSNLNVSERRLPQNGRFQIKVDHKQIDIRVSTLPSINGESLFLHLTDESEPQLTISELDFSELNLQKFEKALKLPSGMILICGPDGSKNTSMLYSTLTRLASENHRIITIEDPIELRMPGITQVEVNEQLGLTFAHALRSVLRQDPNIVMVSDIHDRETFEMAIKTTLTGRMVLGAIYGGSAIKTISRLMDMNKDSHLLGASLSCVVAQRLVRRICRQCAQSVTATEDEIKLFEANQVLHSEDQKNGKGIIGNFRTLVSTQISGKLTVTRGTGCIVCKDTGYRGVVALQEVLLIDGKLRELITGQRPIQEIESHLVQIGYKTILYDGLIKAREGITTVEEVLKTVD
ncbi:type IV pilus assembly protein PilB [Paenibacillus sp. yr247]|uniref:GspE/PulE family protein n=1 Tax=Paenibacillus sp. yr247 TaxID=1761880 RepID=UPI000884248E|nr:GspE/PulE family protein [Paenibacillus sp. yr247]SDP05364.1 type IV pilus assembly protein PilB [Paenibacillus sp. yr247]